MALAVLMAMTSLSFAIYGVFSARLSIEDRLRSVFIASVLAIAPTIVWICTAWNWHANVASDDQRGNWAWTPLQSVAAVSMAAALAGQHVYFRFAARGEIPSEPLFLFALGWLLAVVAAVVVLVLTLRFGPSASKWLALAILQITVLGLLKAWLGVVSYAAAV